MDKQQLANKIWESANKLRSKIEANEYKDYIRIHVLQVFVSKRGGVIKYTVSNSKNGI